MSLPDTGTGYWSLKGSKAEPPVIVYQIEAYPKEAEGLAQGCCRIGECRDKVALALDEGDVLREEESVAFLLAKIR